MSKERVKVLLKELHEELANTKVDEELAQLARTLDQDIDKVIEQVATESQASDLLDRAGELEVRFATTHPVAEGLLREIVNVLGRMGI